MQKIPLCLTILFVGYLSLSCNGPSKSEIEFTPEQNTAFEQAQANGILVNTGLERCRLFVKDWLAQADSSTGLIPKNLYTDLDIWNAKDAAADNYPFMVLTAAITDKELFEGRMLDMLKNETRLTSRIDRMPDTYSFSKKGFDNPEADLESILFGSSEYIKDGLLPLTEWLGKSPWSERMIGILDDMWKHAPVETKFGKIVSTNVEENGEMLQVLSRVYWMTGEQKYLDWAIRLGDYYLLGDQHPTRDFTGLRLRDHGCEVVSGLSELYVTTHYASKGKKAEYQPHIHEMLDRILEVGRNKDGLFYDAINPQTGAILKERVADNFGYTFNAFYSVYQIDAVEAYRTATLKGLSVLNDKYRNYDWEDGSSDGYADAIEGALNLYAREPIASTAAWIDSETQVMWSLQDKSLRPNTSQWNSSGVIEGWHGDGNFARTTIMYCLWKTQGVTAYPWRSDIQIGAVKENGDLLISLNVEQDWEGVLKFDTPRHQTIMHMPSDWPRINQFPEWFTLEKDKNYEMINYTEQSEQSFSYQKLKEGIPLSLKKGVHKFIVKTAS
ncbi:hypothetical protein [Arcticibacterium luteifluviistationis]|uniref:Uncharacterized protein n=1 Tax=Arcticibacterium luteifluviistationis TaxID=1784714 RepID=A0A2Z4G9D3_9BACT|nr:hypothetical protein [Arcticibacterium luteifluviistationis]AWV97668.1 hypothetical protein DJ013_05610 [Arcticibacterium luteifluviistationis]